MQSAHLKALLMTVGFITAIAVGWQVGTASYLLPAAVGGLCLVSLAYGLLWRGVSGEALVTGFLIFGYIVGNRGFANLTIGGPLYLGEVGMIVCFLIFCARIAFTKARLIPQEPMAWAIMAFTTVGSVRCLIDVIEETQVPLPNIQVVLRDFATVYYSFFYIVGYHAGRSERSKAFLERVLIAAFVMLIPSYLIFVYWPDLYTHLEIRGFPIITHKGDLVCAFAVAGFVFLYVRSREARAGFLWLITSLTCLSLLFISGMARAALVGLFFVNSVLIYARCYRIIFNQIAFCAIGAALIIGISAVFSHSDSEENLAYRLGEKALSTIDVTGTRKYRLSSSDSSAQNVRFRTFWWRAVVEETVEKNPVFGLGFGYDLAKRFLRTYEVRLGPEEMETRSPHSILVTVFGRMGMIGVIFFGIILVQIWNACLAYGKTIKRGGGIDYTLAAWCGVVVILISAFFGVVLEGPMAAIPFWTLLGLARGADPRFAKQEVAPLPERVMKESFRRPMPALR